MVQPNGLGSLLSVVEGLGGFGAVAPPSATTSSNSPAASTVTTPQLTGSRLWTKIWCCLAMPMWDTKCRCRAH